MNHIKWTHIEAFKNVKHFVNKYVNKPLKVEYKGKIKLHGTNAGIQIKNGNCIAQSRNRILSTTEDHYSFAKWVDSISSTLKDVSEHIVIFGEHCGEGIMDRTSLQKIGKKIFSIFCIVKIDSDEKEYLIFEPEEIKAMLPKDFLSLDDVYVLPWGTESIICDFELEDDISLKVNIFNDYVSKIEELDPWVEKEFGIRGNGEGYVFYPANIDSTELFYELMFKAKGLKHKSGTTSVKKFVEVTPLQIESENEFVKEFVTSDRLVQAIQESCKNDFSMKNIGKFLKWIKEDIKREARLEVISNSLDWARVGKKIDSKSKEWFLSQRLSDDF